jgi:hypothetical protein
MTNKKNLVIAVLSTFCLVSTLFMILPTRSQTTQPYDPWVDLDDDGDIDLYDAVELLARYGSKGTPINKTALLLDLLERVEALESASFGVPIGSIIAWAKNLSGVPLLPEGFVECNGQILDDPESPFNGITMPDLNGENRFLRGASTSGSVGGSDTHEHNLIGGTGNVLVTNQNGEWLIVYSAGPSYVVHQNSLPASNLPRYYEVVWIIRVK